TKDLETLTQRRHQDIEAEQATAQREQSAMDVCPTFGARPELPLSRQPTQRPFHDPAGFPEPTAMRGALAGDHRSDASAPQAAAVRLRTVGPVGIQTLGATAGTSSLAAHRRNRVYQRFELFDVMLVGGGERGGQRGPTAVDDHMVLAPLFPPIHGAR